MHCAKQSRRLAPEYRDRAGLDLGLGTIPESRSAVIETRASLLRNVRVAGALVMEPFKWS